MPAASVNAESAMSRTLNPHVIDEYCGLALHPGFNSVKEIKAFKFRLALGPNIIKSTNFKIRITPKGIIFSGKGWGHGVGMCQWGAFGMAKRRFACKLILDFYYPGAKLKYYDEVIRF